MTDPLPDRLVAVFASIDARRQSFLDQLLDYLRMPSISAHGVGMESVAAFLVERLGALGMQSRAIATAGWPMVYARRDDAPGTPTVLLYGHYDAPNENIEVERFITGIKTGAALLTYLGSG